MPLRSTPPAQTSESSQVSNQANGSTLVVNLEFSKLKLWTILFFFVFCNHLFDILFPNKLSAGCLLYVCWNWDLCSGLNNKMKEILSISQLFKISFLWARFDSFILNDNNNKKKI